jgi:uncharacterized protein (UPF0262 family)
MSARSPSGSIAREQVREAAIVQAKTPFRIVRIELGPGMGERPPEIEQERQVAIYDLLEDNNFRPKGSPGGPYHLILATEENRLVFDVRLADGGAHGRILLSLTPFHRVLRDYRQVCESYYAAIRSAPARIEAIDMGRRGLHDDGSNLLRERLEGKIELDFDTARRLFTLLAALSL